jgi:hypothetical protein
MVRNSKIYGILTTLKGWCFAYRNNQGQLWATPMFESHPLPPNTIPSDEYRQPNVTTMMAIYYLSHLCYNVADTPEIAPPGRVGQVDIPFANPDQAVAAPGVGVRAPPGLRNILPAPPRQNPQHPQPNYPPNYAVRFEPWVKENQLGGKTWVVDLYPPQTKAVIKLWDGEDNEYEKNNEVEAYRRLQPLWGSCVPTFFAVDIWEYSNSIVIDYIKVCLIHHALMSRLRPFQPEC